MIFCFPPLRPAVLTFNTSKTSITIDKECSIFPDKSKLKHMCYNNYSSPRFNWKELIMWDHKPFSFSSKRICITMMVDPERYDCEEYIGERNTCPHAARCEINHITTCIFFNKKKKKVSCTCVKMHTYVLCYFLLNNQPSK